MTARATELEKLLRANDWFMNVLRVGAAVAAPDWWIGAGVLRDVVWGERFGSGFDARETKDVDYVFFDSEDLRPARDEEVEAALTSRAPAVKWDAKNQAAVHLWFPERFGYQVEPLESTIDGIATWPEVVTCVGVRIEPDDSLSIAAPYGLDDLLDGVWRQNPVRVTAEEYQRRLRDKDVTRRWPGVRVVDR